MITITKGWSCNWLSVSNLIIVDRAVMIYKIMNGLCPDNLRRRLVTRSQISNYPTRNQLDLDTPRQNLEFSKSSFFYSGAKTWNEIPLEIRRSSTITMFKRKLKEFLQNYHPSRSTIPRKTSNFLRFCKYVNKYLYSFFLFRADRVLC